MDSIKSFLVLLLLIVSSRTVAQHVVVDQRADESTLQFLDEVNNLRYLNETFVVQPLSRSEVYGYLSRMSIDDMNVRQTDSRTFNQLAFLKDGPAGTRPELEQWLTSPFKFNKRYKQPDLFYYHQGLVTISINPIAGGTYYSNENGVNWQRRIGADFQAYIGKIGIYGSVRDAYELKPQYFDSLAAPKEGAIYKRNADGSGEFSETRGGITYGGDWGYVGFVKDYVRWGYGYYGTNIFDTHTPPFAQIKLHLNPVEWFQFDYFHGFLSSNVVDSNSIQIINGVSTFDFQNKFIAANMLSIRPWKPLWFSLGNSIVYSAATPEWTFFVPVQFFKSTDHYLNRRSNRAGGNAQMFGALSFRPGLGLHMYSTIFVDEISFRNALDEDKSSNWFSVKSGVRWSNFLPNTSVTIEYLRSNPMVYKHFIETTNFDNAGYNMGHYLRDNAEEVIVGLDFKPLWWLSLHGRYTFAQKGVDQEDDRTLINPETGELAVLGVPFVDPPIWIQSSYLFLVEVIPVYRLRLHASVQKINRPLPNLRYESPYYYGNNLTFAFGLNYGF